MLPRPANTGTVKAVMPLGAHVVYEIDVALNLSLKIM